MNEEMPIISVIVPFHNNVRELSKALKSLLGQSFRDFELLLIDDGSTDTSLDIVIKAIEGDERCTIIHQDNQGVSVARNQGMDKAKGRYFCFMDADDYVGPDYLKHLYEKVCQLKGRGLVISGAHQVYEDGTKLTDIVLPNAFVDKEDFLKLFTELEIQKYGYPWGKLYDATLIKEMSLRFPLIPNREDLIFMLQYLLRCDYYCMLADMDYYYVRAFNPSHSLSVKMAPFEQEFIGYDMYVRCIDSFSARYKFSLDVVEPVMKSIMITFQRAIKSDYQPDTKISRRERIAHLKKIVDAYPNHLVNYYHPDYLIDKICRTYLLRGYYRCYDIMVRLVFSLGIKNKMFFGPQ